MSTLSFTLVCGIKYEINIIPINDDKTMSLAFFPQFSGLSNKTITTVSMAAIHTPLPPDSSDAKIEAIETIANKKLEAFRSLLIKNKQIRPDMDTYKVTMPELS
jgi:hypothetical protein